MKLFILILLIVRCVYAIDLKGYMTKPSCTKVEGTEGDAVVVRYAPDSMQKTAAACSTLLKNEIDFYCIEKKSKSAIVHYLIPCLGLPEGDKTKGEKDPYICDFKSPKYKCPALSDSLKNKFKLK